MEFSPIWSTITTEINKSVPWFCLFSVILPKDLSCWHALNYNDIFLCNTPAWFHYEVNVLALGKFSPVLGLVIFTCLGLIPKKRQEIEFGFMKFHCSPQKQSSGVAFSKRSWLKLGSSGLSLLTFSHFQWSPEVRQDPELWYSC